MNTNIVKLINNKLFKYYLKDEFIHRYNNDIQILKKGIERIDNNLKELKDAAETKESILHDKQYKESIKIAENLIRLKSENTIKLNNLEHEIDKLSLDWSEIHYLISDFDDCTKKILELKYNKGLTEQTIAIKLHLSQSQINKLKNKVINKIYSDEINLGLKVVKGS